MLGWRVATGVSTSLFLNLVTSFAAAVVFAWNKLVDFKFCFMFLPGTIVGSILEALLSSQAPTNLLLGVFSVFLACAGTMMTLSVREKKKEETRKPSAGIGVVAVVVIVSFLVGMLSSLIGVGGHSIVGQLQYLLLATTVFAALIGAAIRSLVTVKASSSFVNSVHRVQHPDRPSHVIDLRFMNPSHIS